MIKKLFTRNQPQAHAPEGERLYAIGDIHGCISELNALLKLIEKDANSDLETRIIFLGDYVDRGPDSNAVIQRLIEFGEENENAVFLKGNHEAAMLDFLYDPEDMIQWLDWGGEETLKSYGIGSVLGRTREDISDEVAEKIPEDHIAFLENLDLTYFAGDYLFVHAGVRPGVALKDQQEEDLLWIRKPFQNASADERPEQTVVHGHQPIKAPRDAGWRINVDTGACWSGMLSAVVLEGDERRFITT
ncbi:MAG: serine/threonine protein phosphatase [Marinicaulis sp.]|nr:serine/threonine protein phosphatase [Marinicaulis sp.]